MRSWILVSFLLLAGAFIYAECCTGGDVTSDGFESEKDGEGTDGEAEGDAEGDGGEGEEGGEEEGGGDPSQCQVAKVRELAAKHVDDSGENLKAAARVLQDETEKALGGRWQAVVSTCPFAYLNWYAGRNICRLMTESGKHVLVWKD